MNHKEIQQRFYDVLRGEAPAPDKAAVENHVKECGRCAGEFEELKKAFAALSPLVDDPAAAQTEEFWQQFSRIVDLRINESARRKPSLVHELDEFLLWLVGRQKWVVGISASVAVTIVALLIWDPFQPPATTTPQIAQSVQPQQSPVESTAAQMPTTTGSLPGGLTAVPASMEMRARAADYFRKSKVLLVGLSNMKFDRRQPVDLSAEQQLSRHLVGEARYLKNQPLDLRSVRLVTDLEQVMAKIAAANAAADVPTVQTIQDGIHRSNLLFKVRMVESMYDTTR